MKFGALVDVDKCYLTVIFKVRNFSTF